MAVLLDVKGLTKSFGVKVVDDLSLTVDAGDAVGIVGPNGAGKTTMLNLIAGDLDARCGERRVRRRRRDASRLPTGGAMRASPGRRRSRARSSR